MMLFSAHKTEKNLKVNAAIKSCLTQKTREACFTSYYSTVGVDYARDFTIKYARSDEYTAIFLRRLSFLFVKR